MNIRNKKGSKMKTKVSFYYKLIFSAVILISIIDRAGIFALTIKPYSFFSFTSISNICVLAVTLYGVFAGRRSLDDITPRFARIQYLCLIMILITGIVYSFILLPDKLANNPDYKFFTIPNIVGHYVAPVGMLIDWLLFGKKGQLTKREPIICICVPLLYCVIAIIYGNIGPEIPGLNSSYVYFFMDPAVSGWSGVIIWTLAMLAGIVLLTLAFYVLDRKMAHKKN